MHILRILSFILPAILISLAFTGCPTKPPADNGGEGEQGKVVEQESEYQAAETLAKRYLFYKLALQEGELAPMVARPETLTGSEIPETPAQLNTFWWKTDWEGSSLSPLSPAAMANLEPDIFNQIAVNIEEENEGGKWIMISLGYDPYYLKTLIADSHSEWQPEQRLLYFNFSEDDCTEVWCAEIQGEWKIVAGFRCEDNVSNPTPPDPPEKEAEVTELDPGEVGQSADGNTGEIDGN